MTYAFDDARLPQRFWDKVEPEPNTGCWLWTANIRRGYATYSKKRVNYIGSRVAYQALVGEIPEGLVINHLCKMKCCVNPAHLEPVTRGENTRRAKWSHCKRCGAGLQFVAADGHRRCLTCRNARQRAFYHKPANRLAQLSRERARYQNDPAYRERKKAAVRARKARLKAAVLEAARVGICGERDG